MKAYVIKKCRTAGEVNLKAGKVVELDKKVDMKLFDLGLVEEYDEDKHGKKKETIDSLKAEIAALKKSSDVSKKDKEIEELKAEVESLKSSGTDTELIEKLEKFVGMAINCNKGNAPEGWEEYLASKGE